ncbi:hypothetical protein V2K62_26055 [Pseudomonas alliivorans]|uniref:Lipoprotein n=1 Tax=Pseudomonas alliivorans TaxID=2810613 RepID=A0ABS4CDV9_9PSED|nr:hypothetical protein [Pseudomonas alliivorans]MBP0948823.1 hypothetical protein [Pseudomonas alliivorans]MCO5368801.1 hypothetical protein [Pseudomonas alliivorans]MEE4329207.1 hypothetical protein [Pseudomonas alliivorans]MEE4337047.1 hypothetical protein [Pseudomonas alliivorans]MEE4370736.1 hypothetical protein [Pseudomonas alliivorans]
MDKLKRFCAGSLAALFLLTGCARGIQAREITPQDNGYINLYFADQSPQCELSFGGWYEFVESPRGDSDYCKHLRNGGYFQLNNVHSASTIWLVNGRPKTGQISSSPKHCTSRPASTLVFNWWKLTTIKEPTSMVEKVRIEDLKTKKIGDIVVPGVRLTEKYDSGNRPAYPNDINCVILEVSP